MRTTFVNPKFNFFLYCR